MEQFWNFLQPAVSVINISRGGTWNITAAGKIICRSPYGFILGYAWSLLEGRWVKGTWQTIHRVSHTFQVSLAQGKNALEGTFCAAKHWWACTPFTRAISPDSSPGFSQDSMRQHNNNGEAVQIMTNEGESEAVLKTEDCEDCKTVTFCIWGACALCWALLFNIFGN